MTAKKASDADIVAIMNKIQAQLAVLDRKLDAFMTKSLKELADAKAAVEKKAQHVPAPVHHPAPRPEPRPGRPMFAIVCHSCGRDAELPFKPSGDRPVYCPECFSKRRAEQRAASNPAVQKPQMVSLAAAPVSAPESKAKKSTAVKKTATKKTAAKKAAPKKKTAKKK